MHEDNNWITLAKSGNQKAFRVLYDENVSPLFRFLKQFSQREGEVHEWVQRAFIKAFEHLDSFDQRSKFSSWLFRLAINEMKMDRRRERIVAFESLDRLDDITEPDEPSFEWHQTMKSWMGELDETKRMVFILYEVEGFSHAEIASTLGIAESSSRTFLVRAKRILQDRWNKEIKG
jgi:RNA polymerase sigma-70 factor (ECF subfamily)